MNIEASKEVLFRSFGAWFFELARLADHSDDNSGLPKLELSLRSGHVIRGSIIKIEENISDQLLMILGMPDPYSKTEITFVSSGEVVALTLLEPETYLTHLTVPADHKSVGVLELKRAAQNVEAELEKILGHAVRIMLDVDRVPEGSRWDVLRTLGFLPSILKLIATDALGKKQVQENIGSICVRSGEKNETELTQRQLTLSIASPLSITVAREKERLRKEVESVL